MPLGPKLLLPYRGRPLLQRHLWPLPTSIPFANFPFGNNHQGTNIGAFIEIGTDTEGPQLREAAIWAQHRPCRWPTPGSPRARHTRQPVTLGGLSKWCVIAAGKGHPGRAPVECQVSSPEDCNYEPFALIAGGVSVAGMVSKAVHRANSQEGPQWSITFLHGPATPLCCQGVGCEIVPGLILRGSKTGPPHGVGRWHGA